MKIEKIEIKEGAEKQGQHGMFKPSWLAVEIGGKKFNVFDKELRTKIEAYGLGADVLIKTKIEGKYENLVSIDLNKGEEFIDDIAQTPKIEPKVDWDKINARKDAESRRIVRQNALTQANALIGNLKEIKLLKVNENEAYYVDLLFAIAKKCEDWVYRD